MQLIIIGGAQRSGTTLLQTLLANALNAPLLPEAHILCDILAAYKRANEFGHKTYFFYQRKMNLAAFSARFWNATFLISSRGVGSTSVLVLKDPESDSRPR